jgi:hypothetical protein
MEPQLMAGNSSRRGAVRKDSTKRKTAGSGGRVRRGLEGKGPTPKAEDRVYHKAHQRKQAPRGAGGRKPAPGRKRGGETEWIAGRNPVVEALRDPDDVRTWLADHVWMPKPGDPAAGRVGLEVELFPFWLGQGGRPAARLALVEIVGIVDGVPGAVRKPDVGDGRPSWLLDGALITEEPGAQLEIAGPPEADAGQAIAGIDAALKVGDRDHGRVPAAFDRGGWMEYD